MERKECKNEQKKTWQRRAAVVAVAVLFDSGYRRFGYFATNAMMEGQDKKQHRKKGENENAIHQETISKYDRAV